MEKFSDIEKKINYGGLVFDNTTLTEDDLNFIFNNADVIKKVVHLQLSNCNIEALPESIEKLYKLDDLYLNNNNIKILPKTLENLKLNKLVLLGNKDLLANRHNIDILFNIFNRKTGERSKPTILVDNKFGGLDLYTGRHPKNNPNKNLNKNRLLEDDFENLYKELNIPSPNSSISSKSSRGSRSSRASRRSRGSRGSRGGSRRSRGSRKSK